MTFSIDIEDAKRQFPELTFVSALTPSMQKAAFHVQDVDGQDLCLKIISPSYEIDRLHREISAMQTISHPNIVRLLEYTFSSTPGSLRHFVVEEYIAGDDLESHLSTSWDRIRVAKVFGSLFDGLEVLNDHAIVHRDLKPSNIRLTQNGDPVIIDFGLSRLLQLSDLTTTAEGAQIGTPTYFSPEQFDGSKHHIDHRTDLFAAGIIMYQALVGCHPFYKHGMTRAELHMQICTSNDFTKVDHFVQLPKEWQLILKKLLEKERSSRIYSAAQAAKVVRKLESI